MEKMNKSVSGYIALEFVITKEDSQYSSWCPELDIASCGDNPEEAVKNLGDAVEVYLKTLQEEGIQKRVLKERGIRIVGPDESVVPKSFITQYRQKFPVHA